MSAATAEKMPNPIVEFRHQLDSMGEQFKAALPSHIPAERFARVVMTAIQNNPKLLQCTRQSLWNACMRAAQDGLLPDGREGAIVSYGDDEDGKGSSKVAQWMPMIGGIRKKARNSGELAGWEAHCVYENDHFDFELGDEPFIRHKPALGDRGEIIAAYSIATLKDGYKSREVMSIKEIEGVRSKSKAKKGPWRDPIFYPEMCKKVVARRHAKVLPMSGDLDDLIRRDDALYDLEGAKEEAQQTRPRSLSGRLDALAASEPRQEEIPAGPVIEHAATQEPADGQVSDPAPDTGQPEERLPESNTGAGEASDMGPDESQKLRAEAIEFLKGATTQKAVTTWLKNNVEPKREAMFPGDLGDIDRARDAALNRIAGE